MNLACRAVEHPLVSAIEHAIGIHWVTHARTDRWQMT